MAAKRVMTAKVRELARMFSPEDLAQMSLLLAEEAEKPHFDKRQFARLRKAVATSYRKVLLAEDSLTTFMAEAGQTNDEINTAIKQARMEAEREVLPSAAPKKRRSRPKKTATQLGLDE